MFFLSMCLVLTGNWNAVVGQPAIKEISNSTGLLAWSSFPSLFSHACTRDLTCGNLIRVNIRLSQFQAFLFERSGCTVPRSRLCVFAHSRWKSGEQKWKWCTWYYPKQIMEGGNSWDGCQADDECVGEPESVKAWGSNTPLWLNCKMGFA